MTVDVVCSMNNKWTMDGYIVEGTHTGHDASSIPSVYVSKFTVGNASSTPITTVLLDANKTYTLFLTSSDFTTNVNTYYNGTEVAHYYNSSDPYNTVFNTNNPIDKISISIWD